MEETEEFCTETGSESETLQLDPERLLGGSTTNEDVPQEVQAQKPNKEMSCGAIFKMSILICINLLNYMDRFTIAGVLTSVQAFYEISDAEAGLLQSAFIVFFMFSSPACGFLGDRYNRKWILIVGMVVWMGAVLASSFIPKDKFWLFVLLRGVLGIGEASYTTISPSIIADIFTGQNRSRMLMVFYFAIPCGSGLGFIAASNVSALTGDWTWGIRVTVIFGIICLAMTVVFIEEPERGAAEGSSPATLAATSYWDDIKALVKNRTYVFATAGTTAIVFTVGTLAWWAVTTIEHSEASKLGLNSTALLDPQVKARTNLIFGAITCAGGIVGVAFGSILSMLLRAGYGPFKRIQTVRSDGIICGVGALISVPTLFFALHMIPVNMAIAWIFLFITITATCFNWATNVDMVMDVVIPTRRNAANSWQILISHMFGDASGPYIVGILSDLTRGDSTPAENYRSLVTSFYLPTALLLLSAVLFFCAAYTFVYDNNKFKEYMCQSTTGSKPAPSALPDTVPPTPAPIKSDEGDVPTSSTVPRNEEGDVTKVTPSKEDENEPQPPHSTPKSDRGDDDQPKGEATPSSNERTPQKDDEAEAAPPADENLPEQEEQKQETT